MKKILLLIMFIIYSSSFVCAVETRINTNTDKNITETISILEEQIKNIKDIMDLNKQNTRDFLRDCNNNQQNQILIIDNIKYYINSILIILGIVVTIFVAILGIFIWKENKKSREAMLESKKDYEKAQALYEKSIEKLEQCSDKLNSKIEEFDRKFEDMYKDKEKKFTQLYNDKEKGLQSLSEEFDRKFEDMYKEKEKEFTQLYNDKEKGLQFISNEITNISKIVKKELKNNQEVSNLVLEMNKEIGKENFTNVLSISERIIKLDENNEWGYYGKATALLSISNNKEIELNDALDNIEKAIKINGEKELFKVTKAVICGRLGKIQESLDIYLSLKDKNIFVLINMSEMKIITNKMMELTEELSKLEHEVKNNLENQINFNVLKTEIMCIEDKNFEEIKNFVQENIFKLCKNKKLYWSFHEIYSSLILNKDSYLNDSQKDKLSKIIEYIKQNLEVVC